MSVTLSATSSATPQVVAEWVRIFPRQVTETYTSSVTFMKQLTVIAVSAITYLRSVLTEQNYTMESFGGLQVKILKKKCRDELAQFVSTALTHSFEAFEKKYLHKLALCFYDGEYNADNLLEYYIFEFTYKSEGVTLDLRSKSRGSVEHSSKYTFDNIRDQTQHMLRSVVVILNTINHELPPSFDVSLQLYYNEEAPLDYQAPGFVATGADEDHLALAHGNVDGVCLGRVETPFHCFVAHSYIRDNVPSSHKATASQNTPVMTQNEGEDFCGSGAMDSESSVPRLCCQCRGEDEPAPRDDRLYVMLTCEYCGTLQHAACYGVQRGVARHCCLRCSDADPARPPTDTHLARLPRNMRQSLCIFRRTLAWLRGAGGTCPRAGALAARLGLTPRSAGKLVKLLLSHGVLQPIPGENPEFDWKIIPEQVNNAIAKFFQKEEPDMVDRLLAETLSETALDPVGAALSSLEKASLQHATAMGKIMEHTPPDSVVQDSTLKQYREALQSSEQHVEEELPLSGTNNPVKDVKRIGKTTKRKMNDQQTRLLRSGKAKSRKT